MADIDKQNYCNQEVASEKSTKSIVNLLVNLGFKKKDYCYEGRKALWNKYAEEIRKDDKSGKLSTEYKGSARQNVAFVRFIENKIVKEKSIIDPKTGDFKKVDVLKEGEKCRASKVRSGVEKASKDLVHKKEERRREEPKPEPKDEPKPAPKEEPKPAPKDEPKPAPKDEPKPAPKDEPKPAPKAAPKDEPKPAPKRGGDVPPQVVVDKPLSRGESTVKGGGTEGKREDVKIEEGEKEIHQIEKKYDEEEAFVKAQLDKWTKDNEGSPFDTGPGGSDGTQRGRYKVRGDAVVLDNISGKKLKVNKDPAKADKIKDYVTGKEKPLTGEPLVCIDAAQRVEAELFGAKVPRGNRSVAAFEGYAAGKKQDYEVHNVNWRYSKRGELPKLPIACRPGDMITLGYTNSKGRVQHGRHIVVVTRVDEDGLPMEVVNSAAITGGVGKRPFFEDINTQDLEDYDGDPRSPAACYKNVVIKKIIRPKAVHAQYVAYKARQQNKDLAQSN